MITFFWVDGVCLYIYKKSIEQLGYYLLALIFSDAGNANKLSLRNPFQFYDEIYYMWK